MALRLRARLPQAGGAEESLVALNDFLFEDLGYWGNADDYYDPRNSYLNEVIDRKTGIPITLSILYMEVGRRIGLPLEGVSFPGHFLVRLRLRGGVLVLDPFAGGAPQSEAELRERLQRVIPPGVTDNVPVAEEVALKTYAATRGALVMGPDCGTAVLDGVGLGFANAVRPGRIGLVAASGTGCQQLLALLHHAGDHLAGQGAVARLVDLDDALRRACVEGFPATDR